MIESLLEQMHERLHDRVPGLSRRWAARFTSGHLFVGDTAALGISMRHHPLTPMTDANLVRVLARQSAFSVGLVPFGDVEKGVAAHSRAFRGTDGPTATRWRSSTRCSTAMSMR